MKTDHATGYDYVNLCINASSCNFGALIGKTTPSNSRSAVNCDDLSNLFTSVYYDCNSNSYEIQLQGVSPGFDVGWAEGSDPYIYSNDMFYSTTTPGLYCYIIGSDNPCCYVEGCVEVIGDEVPLFNVILDFSDGLNNTINLDFSIINFTGMATPITIRLYDSNQNQIGSTTIISETNIPTPFNGLEIGQEYCVEYTDTNGCIEEVCFTVEGETCPAYIYFDEAVEILPEECENGQGSILITAFEASINCLESTLNFLWSTGDTDGFVEGLSSGNYCVTLTSNGGSCDNCIAVKCFDIENSCDPCDEPLIVTTRTSDICRQVWWEWDYTYKEGYYFSSGLIDISTDGGCDEYTIEWDDGDISGFKRIIYDPGTYCASIIDPCCNEEVYTCWTIDINYVSRGCNSVVAFRGVDIEIDNKEIMVLISNNWKSDFITVDDDMYLENTYKSLDSVSYDLYHILLDTKVGKIEMREDLSKSSQENIGTNQLLENNRIKMALSGSIVSNKDSEIISKVFPNPFQDQMVVEIVSNSIIQAELVVYDILGQKILSKYIEIKNGKNRFEIEFPSNATNGIITISILSKGKIIDSFRAIKIQTK